MKKINVSIVYGLRDQQWLKEMRVPRGTTAVELLQLSEFMSDIEQLKGKDQSELKLGVFAQPVDAEHLMEEGDRLEIYRPLTADPKEVRRQLALLGKTMGKGS